MEARRVGLPVLASGALLRPFIRNICSSWLHVTGWPEGSVQVSGRGGALGTCGFYRLLQAPEGRKG